MGDTPVLPARKREPRAHDEEYWRRFPVLEDVNRRSGKTWPPFKHGPLPEPKGPYAKKPAPPK